MVPGVTETIEPWLTRDERKRAHYRDDPYFWEGRASYLAARPESEALRHLTFLLVKPETIVGRRVAPILEFLRSGGYRIIGTWPVRMGRHEARGLWRYSLNTVPIAHIRALEMLVTSGELFLVGLDHRLAGGQASGQTSAADLLSRAKGSSAHPDARGTLRERLGQPALMLNFVHAPDEPADVLRELAVLCDAPRQEQIMAGLLAAGQWRPARFEAAAAEAAEIMTSRYASCAAHDLDIIATLRRMRDRLGDGGLGPEARAAIELGATSPAHALDVVRSLAAATELPCWDRIVTAAHLVDGLRTGQSPLVGLAPSHAAHRVTAGPRRRTTGRVLAGTAAWSWRCRAPPPGREAAGGSSPPRRATASGKRRCRCARWPRSRFRRPTGESGCGRKGRSRPRPGDRPGALPSR
jgi:nucleoside diphosphate kinase